MLRRLDMVIPDSAQFRHGRQILMIGYWARRCAILITYPILEYVKQVFTPQCCVLSRLWTKLTTRLFLGGRVRM